MYRLFTILALCLMIASVVEVVNWQPKKKTVYQYQLKAIDGTTIAFSSTKEKYEGDTISLYKFYDGENSYEWSIDDENPKLCNSTYISHSILCYRTFGIINKKE